MNSHSADHLHPGQAPHAGCLHANLVPAPDELLGHAFRGAPAAAAERRIFVAEDENAHCR